MSASLSDASPHPTAPRKRCRPYRPVSIPSSLEVLRRTLPDRTGFHCSAFLIATLCMSARLSGAPNALGLGLLVDDAQVRPRAVHQERS